LAASETLSDVADTIDSCTVQNTKTVEAQLILHMANTYLLELMRHVGEGVDPYDAVMKMSLYDLPLSEARQTKPTEDNV
jgi:hypothetical protein